MTWYLRYLSRRLSKVMFVLCHCTLYVNSTARPALAASLVFLLEMSTCMTCFLKHPHAAVLAGSEPCLWLHGNSNTLPSSITLPLGHIWTTMPKLACMPEGRSNPVKDKGQPQSPGELR